MWHLSIIQPTPGWPLLHNQHAIGLHTMTIIANSTRVKTSRTAGFRQTRNNRAGCLKKTNKKSAMI